MPVAQQKLMRQADLIKSLASGGSWSLAGGVIALAFGLLSVVLVARVLGVESYGELGMLQSTIGMLAILATFGLGLTLTKHIAEYQFRDKDKARKVYALTSVFSLCTGTVLCLLTILFSKIITLDILNAEHLVLPLLLFSPVLVLDAWQSVQLGTLAGLQLFKNIALVEMLRAACQCTVVVLASYQWGLIGAVGGLLATRMLIVCVSTWIVYRAFRHRGIEYKFSGSMDQIGILKNFSLPAALSGIAVAPVIWVCNTLVVRETGSFAALGIYNAANQIVTAVRVLGESLAKPLLPMLASDATKGNFLSLVNILFTWAIGAVVAVPLMVFPEMVGIVLGDEYSGPTFEYTLIVVLIVVCIQLYMRGIGREVVARGFIWFNFWSNTFWAVVVLSLAVYLVRYGAVGLALSYMLGYFINLVVFIPFYHKHELVPRSSLVSFWSILVWFSLACSGAIGVLNNSIAEKIFFMLLAVSVIAVAFWKMSGISAQPEKVSV